MFCPSTKQGLGIEYVIEQMYVLYVNHMIDWNVEPSWQCDKTFLLSGLCPDSLWTVLADLSVNQWLFHHWIFTVCHLEDGLYCNPMPDIERWLGKRDDIENAPLSWNLYDNPLLGLYDTDLVKELNEDNESFSWCFSSNSFL